ncbi:MAG: SPFH domain-containing protein [Eubacterium sp.]
MKITDLIKYEGDNNTFIWKHPSEDFNTSTQLIVHESQEAIFMMNGQALDLFGPGRYTLETENIPLIGKSINSTTGGTSPFHCEVYFINKTVQMGLKWGTDSKVRFIDPLTGVPLEIGACGELNLQVSDSRKLLIKLVGTMNGIAWNEEGNKFTQSLKASFKPIISTSVKVNLSKTIVAENIDILEIDSHLDILSSALKNNIISGFEEYGLTIPQFYITTVVLPEEDPNFKKIRELHTISFQTKIAEAEATVRSAQAKAKAEITAAEREIELQKQTTQTEVAKRKAERQVIESQGSAASTKIEGFAEAEVMKAKGYTEKDIIQADVQKEFAKGLGNMGSGGSGGGGSSPMSDIMGLGVGMAAANAMSGQLSGMFSNFANNSNTDNSSNNENTSVTCHNCGAVVPNNAKFCFECGTKIENLSNKIVCPNCKQSIVKGKFCPECGFRLSSICSKCGTEVNGAKFCPECGEKL